MIKQAILMPILVAGVVGWASSASAEMYKWTDSNGKTHYSATPPPADVNAKNIEAEIKLSTGKPKAVEVPDVSATTEQAPPETTPDKPLKSEDTAAASEKQHRSYCDQQKEAFQKLTINSLVKFSDDKGERFLTAAEKQEKMALISKNLDTMCRPEMFGSASGKVPTSASSSAKPLVSTVDTAKTEK
ncbi:DUF4124 domain-containing protein [Candidatus Thiothrix anitrata]|jgi:hypothetical protein|uniref:DUF4124 domain-containing protein n=1 Tax=Candidatus Thiothrix anitrata TaxID=2823902 RepID=A0ABX7X127_9GAMM|nr:DUF4124 domain-containing protein [Candidatus Thiothrix anitrata]QTR49627.1 DUF4124 domain-containing protein [Candidatus Thiothrix anitrata]